MTLLFLLVLTRLLISTGNADVHGGRGQSITLPVDKPDIHLDNVQWIHNNTVIAHLYQGEPPGCLHDNMVLDDKTFSLTISDLQLNAMGSYKFNADGLDTALVYQVVVFDLVQKPIIIPHCNSTSCTLNCTGADKEKTEVSWTDSKGGKESGPVWVVERSEHLNVIYTCNSSNPVSWKTNSISERDMLESIGRKHLMVWVTLALLTLVISLLMWRCCVRRTPIDGVGHRWMSLHFFPGTKQVSTVPV
ncbi:CD48 antigen-like [Alosa sapidissima]|uniref:CD48 antigen-like n=1 Tax=Alosa sapidissima TaxID=34773 RepID=UPI001C0A48F2|nr:CD48 antigen-like [Alosa sapidissima]